MLVLNEEFNKILEDGSYSGLLSIHDKRTPSTIIRHIRDVNIIIQDTYNNPFFPIPRPRIDTGDFDAITVHNYFKSYYSSLRLMMLPWHYLVEFCEYKYIAINTRPIDMRFPISSTYAIENLPLNHDEINLISEIDLSDCIHICIIGDTNKDIYTSNFYKVLKNFCIDPIMRLFKINKTKKDAIHFIRIGKNINKSLIVGF
ncbi:MAG: hypothetical protein QXD03_03765 [Candidatus Anstonellales archaeon]